MLIYPYNFDLYRLLALFEEQKANLVIYDASTKTLTS
jgi:hypothetical protein